MINFCKLLDASTGFVERHFDPIEISDYRGRAGKVIWLDVQDPTEEDFELLKVEFDFHHLALDDCRQAHARPKLEKYADYIFLVVYEVRPERLSHRLNTVELNIFFGANYVVTMHRGTAEVISLVETRWETQEVGAAAEGASYLAYLVIDAAVDSYFPILDSFSDQLEILEEGMFGDFREDVVQEIFQLKKQTLQLRRLVTPLRDVFLVLLRRDDTMFGPRTYLYFQDVLDHLLRVSDAIDTYRDLVSGAVDAYMTTVSNRTNETMKQLTVTSTVLMTAALIAGIYGMNFEAMPELKWKYGYPYALTLMLVCSLGLVALFKRKRYI
ncbi:MAG: magnesium and cobalt transport protein CorA [Cyanobacteria bacterium RYN_339]|nr:magnesium and cobalt transport protein CorA [Cyanobacteria bacterium RYN_339]